MLFFLVLLGLLLIMALAGYSLPKKSQVQRSILINAPSKDIYKTICSFESFKIWNPWSVKDPNIIVEIQGEGIGSYYKWKGNNKVRQGKLTIIELKENEVSFELDFGTQTKSYTSLKIEQEGTQQKVTWTMNTDLGNSPSSRYMGLFLEKYVGRDYEAGLKSLKTLIEQ